MLAENQTMLKMWSHMPIFFSSENVLSRPDTSIFRLSILGWKCVRTIPQKRSRRAGEPGPPLASPASVEPVTPAPVGAVQGKSSTPGASQPVFSGD